MWISKYAELGYTVELNPRVWQTHSLVYKIIITTF